ncbi:MAG: CDP-alcohol phosphatidyltransferase family protein [Bacteroidota bacterium]
MVRENIYLLIPNLIGYVRILFVMVAFYFCFEKHYLFLSFYSMSQLLDGLDGLAARYFRQATRYGAVLDMVTDRASTAALLIASTKVYPQYAQLFMVLITIDIVSHFTHVYSSLVCGKRSHKLIYKDQNWLLRLYYTNKTVLFTLCLGNEAYMLLLYLLHFKPQCSLPLQLRAVILPFLTYSLGMLFALKQLINVVQLIKAAQDTANFDIEERQEE